MKELSVTPSEELDLLIKWLGPDSARQAESIKAASASDHVGGLHKIWDRLDVRYGSPELIEQCLKTKLANFPKLTNTTKDYERLYELYDILCEIQFVENNPQYSQVLAYYDSSTGVNQIVNCLPHNLQEKWSTEAIKYKKRRNMLYPPFSFFVDFTYDMAKWRTDPSFQFAPQTNKTSNPASMQSNLRVSTRKTDVYTIDEKQVCPIHGTNHDLNECRAFRQKPMTERMDLLKNNRLCFRCCSLQKHLQRSCRENIHCNICKSSNHPTALYIYQQDQNIDPNNGSQSVNDCERESCLGQIHRTETVTVNKTFILPDGRTSHFQPCANAFTVKPESIFERTPYDETIGPSIEDKLFIELMDSKVKQGSDNRWTAPLPFRKDRPVLPNNRVQAVQRVNSLERSLRMNPKQKEHILEFMNKMFVNKHAEKAPNLPIGNECWYLPFFGVYHPKKPGKVRIVFDSSAKFSGTSLNDVLIKGPDLTNNLLGVLLRFRKEAVAVTADVEQMFYNFKVTDSHRDYLRFVWHENNEVHRPLIDYRMTVHVFGNSPSPSVATYCLRRAVQNADNDIQDFVYNNFYVDDGLMSCPDVESAVDLMKRTQKALVDGDLSSDLKDLDLGSETPVQRSLGLSWDISVDQFTFKVSSEKKPFTRRGALSVINSIFDPIGFASPITMNGKLILREMMSESGPANWDEDLPDHLKLRWENWVSSLVHLQNLQIPRKYSDISFLNSTHLEVHVFSDASKDAIASVAYLKLFGENKSEVSFLMGKAKVSPVHGHTIPRLELCAAVLSVEIADTLKEHLKLDSTCFHFYTDSKLLIKTDINEEVGLSSRFSRLASWKSLVRAIQFLKAFIRKLHQESPPSRQEVEQFIIKTVQAEAFSNDINAISSVGQLLPTSNLLSLSPVLDKHNILRVGGRIRHAKTVELHLQPIIIPKKHHLAVLLTRHYHELTCQSRQTHD
ncbi:Hypothetical predicted protein [Mytilus galloprovincialis]|uniref:Peptidase aspartic putative domain-containing protein n=1 Tax=Mytilus galloprovincialis TaxID=29158 RepID=A0A8B6GD05_MYTGA|nr:Hypothetical predicted protein [Mytilus galloprovincialis]